MTISYRITSSNHHAPIYSEDEVLESIWLIQKELRSGLPKNEQIAAQRQITEFRAMLDALRAGRREPPCSNHCPQFQTKRTTIMTTTYTHELWYRSAVDEDDLEWRRCEDEDVEWNEDLTEYKLIGMSPVVARVETDGQTVTFKFQLKIRFHDEGEYQLRPIKPDLKSPPAKPSAWRAFFLLALTLSYRLLVSKRRGLANSSNSQFAANRRSTAFATNLWHASPTRQHKLLDEPDAKS